MIQEFYILFCSVLAGVVICAVYDFLKIMRRKSLPGVLFSNIHDILFLIIAVGIMFYIVFSVSDGKLRFYQIFGAFSGAFFYFLTLSRFVTYLILKIIAVFLKIFDFFLKILLTPLKFMYKIVYGFLYFVKSFLIRIFKRIKVFFIKRYIFVKKLILKK